MDKFKEIKKGYNVGLGLTSSCNYHCPHCYSRKYFKGKLLFEDIKTICDNIPINSINLGTGESGCHPEFTKIIEYINRKKIKLSLTTNGYSISLLSHEQISLFNDIDFSLDFPSAIEHDNFRGRGAFISVIKGIELCKKLGVETSIVTVLMKPNYKKMKEMIDLCTRLNVNLRINIYKAVNNPEYKLSYDEFWYGIKLLFDNAKIISLTEPIINALIKIRKQKSPCGQISFRIAPSGDIIPCVYWHKSDFTIRDLVIHGINILKKSNTFLEIKEIPALCKGCELLAFCGGGCAARRIYNRGLHYPDEYCFKLKGDKINLNYEIGETKKLVHAGYLCTIIMLCN